MEKSLDALINDPAHFELFQTLKSMRNGAVYGGRLRFAHSLVISLLFRRNIPLMKRLIGVLKMTRDHSVILASFALLYKLILHSLQKVFNKKTPIFEFYAGALGGMIVYGNQSSAFNHGIAHQITLYCSARVILGLGKLLAYKLAKWIKEYEVMNSGTQLIMNKQLLRTEIQKWSWTASAGLSWGLVMYLHRYYPSFLQYSLESSMIYIYDDEKWSNWRSFLGI